MALLGNPRLTVDIDFVGDDVHPSELHLSIMQIAKELKFDAEPVPLDRFVPLPMRSTERQIRIGQFGNLEIYVADPYSRALSKLDRGFTQPAVMGIATISGVMILISQIR